MKIVVVHTRYRERGGEDVMVEAEIDLLRVGGHEVVPVLFDNAEFARGSHLRTARGTLWNDRSALRLRSVLEHERPDVVHVHNTFPAASPAVFWEARDYPVVHTLHNYRWTCVSANLLRDGRPCEDCVGTHPWRGALHGCFHGSYPGSLVVAAMLAHHRRRRTLDHVDRFITVTSFAREKMIEAGLPPDRIAVKPNFTTSAPRPVERADDDPFVLYVGRLSPEKGIDSLATAWRKYDLPRLEVIGEGAAGAVLEGVPNVQRLGALPLERVRERMAAARLLVMPSIWYETFGLVAVEAYSVGLPVIASDIGALAEVVEEGRTGWRVPPGDPEALARAVRRGITDPEWDRVSSEALRVHAERYTPEVNLPLLEAIYREAGAR